MRKYFHFYFNKYILRLAGKQKYYISYSFKRKALWYRVAKVGTRSIKQHLEDDGGSEVLYMSEAPYNPKFYEDYFKFAFVRDPIDRFVSGWKNKVLELNYYNFNESEHEKMKDLDNFITWVEGQNITKCDQHIREQSSLIDLENVDFIGRFENFDEDVSFVFNKLNIKDERIHHENKSKKIPLEITDSQRERIKTIYRRDYDNFYNN